MTIRILIVWLRIKPSNHQDKLIVLLSVSLHASLRSYRLYIIHLYDIDYISYSLYVIDYMIKHVKTYTTIYNERNQQQVKSKQLNKHHQKHIHGCKLSPSRLKISKQGSKSVTVYSLTVCESLTFRGIWLFEKILKCLLIFYYFYRKFIIEHGIIKPYHYYVNISLS